jgi:hypothetical protein
MAGSADSTYSLYGYDSSTGEYQYFKLTPGPGDQSGMPDRPVAQSEVFAVRAYPNPVNNTSRIAFTMPQAGHLSIKIYDVRGRLVRTLVDGVFEAGPGEVIWDGRTQNGKAVAAGVYMYKAKTGRAHATGSVVILN